jgi:tetratricopeptide (TPR) repeat protein
MMFWLAAIASVLFGASAANAVELGDCGHATADRSIAECSLLIQRPQEKPSELAHLLLLRAIAYNAKGDHDRAIADLNKVSRLTGGVEMTSRFSGDLNQAYYHLGFANEKKGDRQSAIFHYRKVVMATSVLDSVLQKTTAALRQLGVSAEEISNWKVEGALASRQRARGRIYGDLDVRHSFRCSNFQREREHSWAILECDEAIRIKPNSINYRHRAHIYFEMGNFDRAFADFDQAIKLDPAAGFPYVDRGTAYGKRGDHDRAIADFDQAVKLDPKLAEAFSGRALAHEKKGEREKAIADYRTARQLHEERTKDPTFIPSIEGLKRLGATP